MINLKNYKFCVTLKILCLFFNLFCVTMAKKRTTKRYYRPKSKWSANISEFSSTTGTLAANSVFHLESTLATNPSQTTLGVSQIYTVKNFEINFEFDQSGIGDITRIENLTAYIMFLPQGMTVTEDFNTEHPEYIMAYQYYGSPQPDTPNYGVRKIKTRMARKLNTGDSVILYLKGQNTYSQSISDPFTIHGLVRWWTKAN